MDRHEPLTPERKALSDRPKVYSPVASETPNRPKTRWTWLSLPYLISHPLVVLRARLVLLLVISAVIMITAALTWKVALNTTNESFNGMSAQLREDVTLGAVNELKNVLNSLLQAISSMHLALQGPKVEGRAPVFDRESLSGPALAAMWSVFKTYTDITTACVISAQNLLSAYRRNGPESAFLGSPIAIGISPPADNMNDTMYVYIPDAKTGAPLVDGRMGKFCLVGRCPTPLDRSVYVEPFPQPINHPTYAMGKDLPEDTILWTANVDGGMQPYLLVIGAFKDTEGKTAAVSFISSVSSRLQPIVQSTSLVKHYNGRMFITVGKDYNMLTASAGTLYMPSPVPGGSPSFISATNSSDTVIREAAIYLNVTHAERVFIKPVKDIMWVHGHGRYYINSIPLQHQGLLVVVVLVVPREEFRGEIDHARQEGLLIAMGIAIALFVGGGLAMCLSTTSLSRFLANQGKKLDKAAAANEALARRLAVLTSAASTSESRPWPRVDMGTPLEKLTTILKGLRRGHLMTQSQVDEIHALISAEDLHRPEFLASMAAIQEGDEGRWGATAAMDTETGEWIGILATGRRTGGDIRKVVPINDSPDTWTPGSHPFSPPAPPLLRWRSSPDVSRHEDSGMSSLAASARSHDEAASEALRMHSNRWTEGTLVRPESVLPIALHKACQCQLDALPPLLLGDSKLAANAKSVRLVSQQAPGVQDQAVAMLRSVTALAELPPGEDIAGHIPGSAAALLVVTVGSLDGGEALACGGSSKSQHGPEGDEAAAAAERLRGQVALLRTLGCWDFDTLALANVVPDGVVPLVGFALFSRMGLIPEFSINETKLVNFLHMIDRGMEAHPYHNAAHVSDVSASLFHLLNESGIGEHIRPIDKLAATCAALVHDYKHPGVNNDFLNRTRDELATVYNDQSPLENFHLAEAFHMLYSNRHCNFLKKLSSTEFMDLRHVVIELVLATDLKRHFGILEQFKARASQDAPWDVRKESDRVLLLQMALKMADIGHAAKTLPLHVEWSRRVTEEIYLQGDAEQKLNLDVSPFMDRFNNNVPRSQLGFFQFLALPLFEAWVKAFPKSAHLMANAMVNIAHWKQELNAVDCKTSDGLHNRS